MAHPIPFQPADDRLQGRSIAMLIVLVLLAGTVLRTASLDRWPLPLHQDELTDIYDGYSLATTGADRWGQRWPILMRGMGPGDYHPPMYAYLAMVSTRLGGFSVVTGRLPAAIAGVATLWLIYLAARRLLGGTGGLLALVFAAFSPILIQYSRQAHPGTCLPPFFAALILVLLLKALQPCAVASSNAFIRGEEDRYPKRRREIRRSVLWFAAAGFAMGLSTNAYSGFRLTALLLAGLAAGLLLWELGIRRSEWTATIGALFLFAIAAGVGASPQLYAMIAEPEHFFARARTTFYSLNNGPRWWIEMLAKNLASNLDPSYLFFSFGSHYSLSVARLSAVALPFFYFGFVAILVAPIRRHGPLAMVLPAAVAFSLLPGIATDVQPSPMRASGVWALYPIVSALGVITLGQLARRAAESVRSQWGWRTGPFADRRCAVCAVSVVSVLVASSGLFDVGRYLSRPDLHGVAAQYHLVRLGRELKALETGFDRVYIDADGLFGYLFISAFSGMTPTEFQAAPREGTITPYGRWEEFHRFGRFHFATLDQARADWLESERNQRWLVYGEKGVVAELSQQRSLLSEGVPYDGR